jgi:hypothetical protein
MKVPFFRRNHYGKIIAIAICLSPLIWFINATAQRSDTLGTPIETVVSGSDATTSWMRTELYYGAGRLPADGTPDQRWEDYINNVVTPRFPEGLTLLEGTGQWRVKPDEKPRRNRSRILILVHEANAEKDRKIEEIITIWKEISGHQSVLRVSMPATVSM